MEGGKIAVNSDFETSEAGESTPSGDVSARTQPMAAAQGTYVVEKIAGRPTALSWR